MARQRYRPASEAAGSENTYTQGQTAGERGGDAGSVGGQIAVQAGIRGGRVREHLYIHDIYTADVYGR